MIVPYKMLTRESLKTAAQSLAADPFSIMTILPLLTYYHHHHHHQHHHHCHHHFCPLLSLITIIVIGVANITVARFILYNHILYHFQTKTRVRESMLQLLSVLIPSPDYDICVRKVT